MPLFWQTSQQSCPNAMICSRFQTVLDLRLRPTWTRSAPDQNRPRDSGDAMHAETLQELLEVQLKDLYSAESQIVKALPKMASAAKSPELKAAFQEHLEQTRDHVERIEQVCSQLGISPKGHKCKVIAT